MPNVEPGGALELAPAATDGATVRWRQLAGPAAAWGQDRDGNAVLAATSRITAPLPVEF